VSAACLILAEKTRLEKLLTEAAAAGKYDEAARLQTELAKMQNQCDPKAIHGNTMQA